MGKGYYIGLSSAVLFGLSVISLAKMYEVGIVFDNSNSANVGIVTSLQSSLKDGFTYQTDKAEILPQNIFTASGSATSLQSVLTSANAKKLDALIIVGPLGSSIASNMNFNVPVDISGSLTKGTQTPTRVITVNGFAVDSAINTFSKALNLTTITLVVPSATVQLYQNYVNVSKLSAKVQVVGDKDSNLIDEISATQGVLFSPFVTFSASDASSLLTILNQKNIPTFAVLPQNFDPNLLYSGFLGASIIAPYAASTAINVQNLLQYQDPSVYVKNQIYQKASVYYNQALINSQQKAPTFASMESATMIDNSQQQPLTLEQAIQISLANNLDIKAQNYQTQASKSAAATAGSLYFPQVNATLTGLAMDPAAAQSTFGVQRQQSFSGGVNLTQVLYSPEVNLNYAVQSNTYKASQLQSQIQIENTIVGTIDAYLNVLKSQALVKVSRSNMELSKQNLNAAKVKTNVGSTSNMEIYRWESKYILDSNQYEQAKATYNIAMQNLDTVMNVSITTTYNLQDVQSNELLIAITPYLTNMLVYQKLQNYLVQVGIANSYEIQQLNQYIDSSQSSKDFQFQQFFIPTVAAFGGYNYNFWESNASYPNGFNNLIGSFSPQTQQAVANMGSGPKGYWNIGVQASLPLFSSGGHVAEYAGANATLQAMQTKKLAAINLIQQNVAYALQNLKTGSINYTKSQEANITAIKNLQLVMNTYQNGVATMLDLLDAQNLEFQTQQNVADAKYTLQSNYYALERSITWMSMEKTSAENQQFIQNLNQAVSGSLQTVNSQK
ncbi:MAG: TolC family protein [Fusobacteria bacterium]|nr:TolC family protein [Fusobacteriota bacterium]